MSYALAQAVVGTNYATSAAARTQAYGSNITSGNLLIVCIGLYGVGVTVTITDSRGDNTWRQAGSYQVNGSDTNGRVAIFYAVAASGGACTVTATPSGSVDLSLAVHEYSGNLSDGATILDGTNGASGSSTTPDTGSITVANAGSLIVGAMTDLNEIVTMSAGTGFTLEYNDRTNSTLFTDDGIFNAASSATFSPSGSIHWNIIGASFKPAATGGAVKYPQLERGTRGVDRGVCLGGA